MLLLKLYCRTRLRWRTFFLLLHQYLLKDPLLQHLLRQDPLLLHQDPLLQHLLCQDRLLRLRQDPLLRQHLLQQYLFRQHLLGHLLVQHPQLQHLLLLQADLSDPPIFCVHFVASLWTRNPSEPTRDLLNVYGRGRPALGLLRGLQWPYSLQKPPNAPASSCLPLPPALQPYLLPRGFPGGPRVSKYVLRNIYL